ncbi:MAG: hypothetical protein NWE96_01530 [Candidatus Bathyarchaeota archaeon]|nr:hypothetical protein [Candidatus Bathyarchaeota archaeon]
MRMQKVKLVLVVILSAALLASSLTAVEAATIKSEKVLPDFIEGSIALMYPNATDAKLAEIRGLWIKQIELREKMIADTNGAVLKFQPSALTVNPSYLTYLTKIEPLYGGQVINPNGILGGSINYDYTRFLTTGLNQGAGIAGRLSYDYSFGQVYVYGKLGPTGPGHTGNYIIVWGSNSGLDWSWEPIGYTQLINSWAYHYVGYTSTTYKYAAVGCNTMMGDQCIYNDLLADMLWFTNT